MMQEKTPWQQPLLVSFGTISEMTAHAGHGSGELEWKDPECSDIVLPPALGRRRK